jgi:predicted alpha/beta hydrolase family esterase
MPASGSHGQDSAGERGTSIANRQKEFSIESNERSIERPDLAAVSAADDEEKYDTKQNNKLLTLRANPSWSLSLAVAVAAATKWWFLYIILSIRHVLGSSSAPQATKTSPKPQFWRVSGIEASDEDHAQEWLRKVSPDRYSLAKVSPHRLCATLVTFDKPTPALAGWSMDNAFLGITPLASPADSVIDIVAVTGLGGHALGSFRSTDGRFVWLRDVLPKTLPKARILTYGYDTALVKNKSKESIRDLAKVFLDALAAFRRRTETQRRPLCFIGHSLGGVVLKEALAISEIHQDNDFHEVVLSTYGLILLGVPNLGLRHPQLMTMVEGQPNQQFVRDLVVDEDEAPSPYLDELTGKFSRVCSRIVPPFHIVSYYETERSSTVKVRSIISDFADTADDDTQVNLPRIALRVDW